MEGKTNASQINFHWCMALKDPPTRQTFQVLTYVEGVEFYPEALGPIVVERETRGQGQLPLASNSPSTSLR